MPFTSRLLALAATVSLALPLAAPVAMANDGMTVETVDQSLALPSPTDGVSMDVQPAVQPTAAMTTPLNQPVVTQPMAPAPQAAPAVATLSPNDYWMLATQPGELRVYSKRKFAAHTITVKNTQPYHIEILNAEVTNALNEQQLAAEKTNSKKRGFTMARLATGLIGSAAYIPGVGGLATMGSGGLALAQASNVANQASWHMGNSGGPGNVNATGQYLQRFNDVVLGPDQTFTFEVVTEKDAQPNLRMVFKNLETSQILDVQETLTASN